MDFFELNLFENPPHASKHRADNSIFEFRSHQLWRICFGSGNKTVLFTRFPVD